MKKYTGVVLIVMAVCLVLVSCTNIYKSGVDYSDFDDKQIPIYEGAIVYLYEADGEGSELEYGVSYDIEDIAEFYREEFEDEDYIIIQEDSGRRDYYFEGYIDNTYFEIQIENASVDEVKHFDYIVNIQTEEVEDEVIEALKANTEAETTETEEVIEETAEETESEESETVVIDENGQIVVATVDGENITKGEFLYEWKYIVDYYGITDEMLENDEYKEQLDELRRSVLEYVVQDEISKIELEKLGYYELSEEEMETVEEQVQEVLANALESKEEEMYEELGEVYSKEELEQAQQKYTQLALEEYGIDEDYIRDYYTYEIATANAEKEYFDITATDEEIEALFDEWVQSDKELFEDFGAYEYYYQEEYDVFYIPEGIRNVRQVLIAFDDEIQQEIAALREAGDDKAADALREDSLDTIYEEALEVYNLIADGDISFDKAISKYNDDLGMDYYPDGYQVSLESAYYIQEFTDAAMELVNIGDISELVGTDYGYHILEYTSDVESGPSDIEPFIEELTEKVIEEKRTEAWTIMLDEWMARHDIVYYYENIY